MTTPQPRAPRIPVPINTRTEMVFAICGVVFSVLSWLVNPWFLASLVGIGFAVRALVRVRRISGRTHRTIMILGVVGVIVGVVGLIGSVLFVVVPTG